MEDLSLMTKSRLRGDMKLLKKHPDPNYEAFPNEKNILEWWFLIKGHEVSDFKGGYYIGKVIHNKEYPLKPPDFMVFTPNGRFLTERKICTSNTGYHSSEWSPGAWNICTILNGFISIWLDDKEGGISHIHDSPKERIAMAKESIKFNKNKYKDIIAKFTKLLDKDGNPISDKEDKAENNKSEDKAEDKAEPKKKPIKKPGRVTNKNDAIK